VKLLAGAAFVFRLAAERIVTSSMLAPLRHRPRRSRSLGGDRPAQRR
jgi:hypothetical protein